MTPRHKTEVPRHPPPVSAFAQLISFNHRGTPRGLVLLLRVEVDVVDGIDLTIVPSIDGGTHSVNYFNR